VDIGAEDMASPILNPGAFSNAELTAMLTAAKAEYLGRITTGRVKTGGSASQQYGMDIMTVDDLTRLINALTSALGLDFDETLRVRPNFNTRGNCLPEQSTFGAQ